MNLLRIPQPGKEESGVCILGHKLAEGRKEEERRAELVFVSGRQKIGGENTLNGPSAVDGSRSNGCVVKYLSSRAYYGWVNAVPNLCYGQDFKLKKIIHPSAVHRSHSLLPSKGYYIPS